MNCAFILPFAYFYKTRLSKGALSFHFVFEWMAAALLVTAFGSMGSGASLAHSVLCYLAFISLYEIGYLVNDLFSAQREAAGRQRGPAGVSRWWVLVWVVARLAVFVWVTALLHQQTVLAWWSYFTAMGVVFFLHNSLVDGEFKVVTFSWLAWFRFMAPVIFVVEPGQIMGIAFGAAMVYAGFRLFGYLDSKDLLRMPGRQRPGFRRFFFVMPLSAALALWPYPEARGFIVLVVYFAIAAMLGTVMSSKPNEENKSR